MTKEHLEPTKVIGIWARTTNHEQQAMQDIQALWGRFMTEQIPGQIPNRVSDTVYSIYTEYEGDYTKPYTTILACEVSSLDEVPEGMKGLEIGGGDYVKFMAKGNIHEGIVGDEWMKIWQTDLDRSYINDFEVYGEKAQNPANSEIDIFVGVK